MYIAILGRQPAISIAELERVYKKARWFSEETALVESDHFYIDQLGGTQKAGKIIKQLPRGDWRQVSMEIVKLYSKSWATYDGKITLGLSAYGFNVSPRDVQKTGLILKAKLKSATASLRLIPNQEAALNTAASHHNKLGLSDNKVELIVVKGKDGSVVVAESVGAQNITALAARDQGRPKRDAFVGMLPPKLAQIMINLTGLDKGLVLDPFCGTGVILQEALLMGYDVHGTDLAPKMIEFTEKNIKWFAEKYPHAVKGRSAEWAIGDATETTWVSQESGKPKPLTIDAVASETYLGQPFSAPPSPAKLTEVRGNCNHIISGFLKNLGKQIRPGTPLCLAVPAWKDANGGFTHLPLIGKLKELGYTRVPFETINHDELLYFRPDQVVARELLVLTKD